MRVPQIRVSFLVLKEGEINVTDTLFFIHV